MSTLQAFNLIPKKYFLLVFLAIVIGILVAILTKKQADTATRNIAPTPSQTILKLLNSTPVNNGEIVAATINAVTLTFDQSIDPLTAEIEVFPNIEIRPISHSNRPSTLVLSPATPWQKNTNYSLTLKGLSSLDRKSRLISPISITFIANEAPPPIYNEPI